MGLEKIDQLIAEQQLDKLDIASILSGDFKQIEPENKNLDTILIVDDDDTQLHSIKKLLSNEYKTITCSSGTQAIELFKNEKNIIMSVLLDIRLPDMDGFEVFRCLKEEDVNVPIIFITGYQNTYGDGYEIFKKYRPHGYIVKNHENEIEMVRNTLANAVDYKKKINELERTKLAEERNKTIAGLLHDLKNMFGPILILPEMIARAITKNNQDKLIEYSTKLKKLINFYNANQMVLFNYAKGEKGTIIKEELLLDNILTEFLEIIDLQYTQQFELLANFAYQETILSEKNTLCCQILLNIIKNSKEAFIINKIPHPQIHISTMSINKYQSLFQENIPNNLKAAIIIKDNAGGLPPEIESIFFDPYVTFGKKGGSGLGSWMIKNGVEEKLNGKLILKNQTGIGLEYHILI